MATQQFFLLPIPESIADEATRLVVYDAGTNDTATIYSDANGVFPYTGGVVTIYPGSRYVSFYANGTYDLEVQDSGYSTLEIWRNVIIRVSEPSYTGDDPDFTLEGLENRILQGGLGGNPTPVSTVVAGVVNLVADYQMHTISATNEEIHTILALYPAGRIITLYFTGTCRLYNYAAGNLALERDYITAPGSTIFLQSIDGKFREIARSDTNEDQQVPSVIATDDTLTLPYNVPTFYVQSVALGGEVANIYQIDSSHDIPNGTVVYLRTWSGQIIYKNLTGNLRLEGDFTAPTGAVISLVSFLNVWHEISRSVTGNNVQQQVALPDDVTQTITLTNTTRAVMLKSTGDANNPAPEVINMVGGADGDEITIMVSPSTIQELPPSSYLSVRVPIRAEYNMSADGYFLLATDKFGMVPGDTLKVIRITDENGYYCWQEVSRSMIDIEIAVTLQKTVEDVVLPHSIDAWRPRINLINTAKQNLEVNNITTSWLPHGTMLALRASALKVVLKSSQVNIATGADPDNLQDSNLVIVSGDNEYTLETGTTSGNKNAYLWKTSDPTNDDYQGSDSIRDWIQFKHPKIN